MRRCRDGTVPSRGYDASPPPLCISSTRKRRIGGGVSSLYSTFPTIPTRRLALLLLLLTCLACPRSRPSLTSTGGLPFFVQAADVVLEAPPSGGTDLDGDDSPPTARAATARNLNVARQRGDGGGGGGGGTIDSAGGGAIPPSRARRAAVADPGFLRRGGATGVGGGAVSAGSGTAGSSRSPRQQQQQQQQQQQTLSEILAKAGKRGLGGGIPGFVAGLIQVLTLMWLRTVINYQCRYGTTFRRAIVTLFNDGGVPRFYRGLGFALIQAPLAKFVATAANEGVGTMLASMSMTQHWGPGRGTVVSSVVVGLWRMALMPIDTCKTVLQVDSSEGFRNLMTKVKAGRIGLLYQGMFALAASSMLSYYPWFYTYNMLSKSGAVQAYFRTALLRNAFVGFVSSVVSDVVSNCIRVVKTTKQSLGVKHAVSYGEVVSIILAADGWTGLFGRGLSTRIFANAIQSVMFTIIWRGLAERWSSDSKDSSTASEDEDTTKNDGLK